MRSISRLFSGPGLASEPVTPNRSRSCSRAARCASCAPRQRSAAASAPLFTRSAVPRRCPAKYSQPKSQKSPIASSTVSSSSILPRKPSR